MSATNRGKDRKPYDYYVTPQDEIKKFLLAYNQVEKDFENAKLIIDPAAGGDNNNEMSYPKVIQNIFNPLEILTVDIRQDSKAQMKTNYLHLNFDLSSNIDIIITNPPFDISMDFILKALEDVKDGGKVIMLLRLNYFGTKRRNIFFQAHMPKYCFIHSKRMSFTPDGKKDSIEYAHFVWEKGLNPEFTKTYVLDY